MAARLTPEERALRAVTEKKYQRQIVDEAKRRGWEFRCHVSPASMANGRWITPTSDPGFPDVWLVRPGRMVVFEIKTQLGRVHPRQEDWIRVLQTIPGVEAYLVRPSDWPEVRALLHEP